MSQQFLLQTPRLGLRNWTEVDKEPFYQMNSDPSVMEHFPAALSRRQSDDLWLRLKNHYQEYGYTYFAVDLLDSGEFIGFIGLKNQDYDYQYTPFVDIGWRILPAYWGKGYATEGAVACLNFAFEQLQLEKVFSVAVHGNLGSLRVMLKLGMRQIDEFIHPAFAADHPLQPCHCYCIENPNL